MMWINAIADEETGEIDGEDDPTVPTSMLKTLVCAWS